MSTKFHTIINQWGLVSGVRQAESDLILVSPARSPFTPESRKGQLVLLAEAEGDVARGREACDLVARTIHDTFYADGSLSITSSLRQAIKAANAALYQYNFEAPPHKRAQVGITCAVLHGSDLFVTQVPPAQAYVGSVGKLRALPIPPSWTSGADVSAINRQGSLGTSLGSEPEFFRSVIQAGDTLVLCSSNIARLLGRQQAEHLICYSDAATIAEELYRLCREAHLPEAHAAVIEVVPGPAPAEQKPVPTASGAWPTPPTPRRVVGWLGRGRPSDGSSVKSPESSAKSRQNAAPLLQADTEPLASRAGTTHNAQQPGIEASPLRDMTPVGDAMPLPPSAFLGEGEYGGTVRPPAAQRRARQIDLSDNAGTPVDFAALPPKATPPPPTPWERASLPLRRLLAGVSGGVANMPRRTARASEQLPARGLRLKGLSYKRSRPRLPWFNIFLIVGIVAMLIVVGMRQNQRRDQDLTNAALAQVSDSVTAALRSSDPEEAQRQLATAEEALSPAGDVGELIQTGLITTTRPAVWSRYLQVRASYDRAMATINRIGFLDDLETVATLPGGQGVVERVLLGTTETISDTPPVFYLDRAAGLLYEVGRPEPLLKPDEQIGPFVSSPIREMLWREGDIIALDRGDQLFPIYHVFLRSGDGWLANQLNGTEHMEPATGDLPMATFGGHLYVWDAKEQQLFRYYSGMYADLPQPWITDAGAAPLDQIVDVEIDGRVWLLTRDASVLVFEGGRLIGQIPPPELTVPISSVSRFVVTPDRYGADGVTLEQPGHIYVLDLRNERILQLSKEDGTLIQQIQARTRGPLNQVSDLAVDESRGMIYLANGPRVLSSALPEPPVPTADPGATATPEE